MQSVRKETREFGEKIYNYLEDLGGEPCTSAKLQTKFNISKNVCYNAIQYCKHVHPSFKSKNGVGFFVTADKKNSEGYPDPTAAAALANIMMSNGVKSEPYIPKTIIYDELFKPGVVFQTLLGRSYVHMYVASVSGPFLYTFALNEKGDGINPTRLFSIDARKASIEGEVTNGTEIMAAAARKAVLDLFGFTPAVEATESNLEYELLKQRADIYEKCFYAVCGKEVQS